MIGAANGRPCLARYLGHAGRACEAPGEQSRAPGVEERLARKPRVERLEPLRGAQEERRSVAPAALGVGGLGAKEVEAGVLQLVQRPHLGRRQERRAPRRTCPRRGSPRQPRAPAPLAARNRRSAPRPAAGMPPPRRGRRAPAPGQPSAPAQPRPPRRGPRPPPRGATHGGPGRCPGRSPRPEQDARLGARPRSPTGRRPSAPADDGMSPVRRLPASRRRPIRPCGCDAESLGRALQQQRVSDRLGRRQQQHEARVGAERVQPANVALLDPARQRHGPQVPKPPASCVVVSPRGSSSSASGLPRVSATIRSRTSSSSMNRTAEPRSARASPSRRPAPPARAGSEAPRPARARRTPSRPAPRAGGAQRTPA